MTRAESRIDGAQAGRDLPMFYPLVDLVDVWDEDRDPDLPIYTDRVVRVTGEAIPKGAPLEVRDDGRIYARASTTEPTT